MTGTYGITITGDVAVITLTVPALWLLAITVLSGIYMTYTTVRDWLAGVLARVWQEDKQAARVGTGWISPTAAVAVDASSHKGSMKIWE